MVRNYENERNTPQRYLEYDTVNHVETRLIASLQQQTVMFMCRDVPWRVSTYP